MAYSINQYGLARYTGTWTPYTGSDGPFLYDATPSDGSYNVTLSDDPVFRIGSVNTFSAANVNTLNVTIEGVAAIINGVFQAGYAGTAVRTAGSTIIEVTFTTCPSFTSRDVGISAYVTDSSSITGYMSWLFAPATGDISGLTAKTWCDGKRIDLSWTNPSGITRVKILRSRYSYADETTDPGTSIYEGAPITGFVDGVYTGALDTTNTDLIEDQFYYYSIFVSYSSGAPYRWLINPLTAQAEGLSIKDYYSKEGDYVYNLLPTNYRKRDASDSRGSDQYLLRDYCRMIQCGVNLVRGWLEGLVRLRDPDNCPAGRLGEADNQKGLLSAYAWDLGMGVERSFDAGVLRRIVLGIVGVYEQKGTCAGLVDLAKILTTWDARCDELIMPVCGISRIFSTWDGESYIGFASGICEDDNYTPSGAKVIELTTEQVTIDETVILDGTGTQLAIPLTSSGVETVSGILTSLGHFACVDSVTKVGTDYVFDLETDSYFFSEIQVTGTGSLNNFQITNVTNYYGPWQFPEPPNAETQFGLNAFTGKTLMDSTGAKFVIASSTSTAGGTTDLTVTGTPATGAGYIADSFNGVAVGTRDPIASVRLLVGEHSFLTDTIWDIRLANELIRGQFSRLAGLGAWGSFGSVASPEEVALWVANEHDELSTSTENYGCVLVDTTKSWTVNEWTDYYLLPNWGQTIVFQIVSNGATWLVVKTSDTDLDAVSTAGMNYVILSKDAAIKYMRLVNMMSSFIPHESKGLVKFETVP